jgi:hypothetical protein
MNMMINAIALKEQTPSYERGKKWQAYYIAPLQPPTLAAFLPWEGSAGAGRVRPAGAKIRVDIFFIRFFLIFFQLLLKKNKTAYHT